VCGAEASRAPSRTHMIEVAGNADAKIRD